MPCVSCRLIHCTDRGIGAWLSARCDRRHRGAEQDRAAARRRSARRRLPRRLPPALASEARYHSLECWREFLFYLYKYIPLYFFNFLYMCCECAGHISKKFDFSVPGVTSVSLDVHKYGYSAKVPAMCCNVPRLEYVLECNAPMIYMFLSC